MAIAFGVAGVALADAPFQRIAASGVPAVVADSTYLRLDTSNDPLTGDSLLFDPPSGTVNVGVDLSPAVDSMLIGDIDGNPAFYFASGKTHIRTIGDLVPSTGGVYDLGDNISRAWDNLFLSGDIELAPGTGNTANITTSGAASEHLLISAMGTNAQVKFDTNLNLQFSYAGGTKLRVDGYGNHIYDDIYPEVDNAYDVGASAKQIRDVYAYEVQSGGALAITAGLGAVTVQSNGIGGEVLLEAEGVTGLEVDSTRVRHHLNVVPASMGLSSNPGLDTASGGACAAPVACSATAAGTQFYCLDPTTTKSGALCLCHRTITDTYEWAAVTTDLTNNPTVCP